MTDRPEVFVRIWSGEHQAYWREGGHGYTRRWVDSGVFSTSEAELMTCHCGPEKQIEIIAAMPDYEI